MAKKVITILEDADGAIIDIRAHGHHKTYEYENLTVALSALLDLTKPQEVPNEKA